MGSKKSRKSPRAQVSLVARYRSPTAFEFVREECFDLSVGGMFIKSPAPAPAGTLLKLECDVDEGAAKIRGVARVVWLREHGVEGHPAGMGVKFVKLEPGGRDVIASILERHGSELDEDGEQRRSHAPQPAVGPFQRTPSARPGDASAIAEPSLHGALELDASASNGATGSPAFSDAITVRPPAASPAPTAASAQAAVTAERSAGAVTMPESVATANSARSASSADVRAGGASDTARERNEPRDLRSRLEQAKRQSGSSAASSGTAHAVARPAPRDRAATRETRRDAPRSKRPLLYAAILLLAAGGVYALARRPSGAVEVAEPAQPPPAEPVMAPAPEPVPAAPTAVVAPPAQDTVPTSIAPTPPRYVLEVVTQPEGARVTAGAQALTAPGELDLGALDGAVVLTAELDGYEPTQTTIDRVGFMLDEGAMRRRMVLKLNAAPKPKPAAETAERKARRARKAARAEAAPKPAPEPAAIASPVAPVEPAPPPPIAAAPAQDGAPVPAPVPVAAPQPKPEPEPEAKPAADEEAAKQKPLDAAMACLGTGDNPCVIKALEGKARTAQELELLIETYRAMGNTAKAEKYMGVYIEKHPGERRSATYRRMLEHQQGGGASPAP